MTFKPISIKEETKTKIQTLQLRLQAIENKRLSLDTIINRLIDMELVRINSIGDSIGRKEVN